MKEKRSVDCYVIMENVSKKYQDSISIETEILLKVKKMLRK